MTDEPMPKVIKARPMMGTVGATTGPWAMDDPYHNATDFYRADLYATGAERIAELEAENARLRPYAELGDWAISVSWPEFADLEALEVFDKAKDLKLFNEIPGGFNPEEHDDQYGASERGDAWYEIKPFPRAALKGPTHDG